MESGTLQKEDYPARLLEWKASPERLWFLGDCDILHERLLVSVVGTRHPSPEGVRRTRKLVQTLVKAGAVIVSGMAEGVDYVGHSTALDLGGKTVAVMGTPIDECYPRKHASLKAEIEAAGLVLSQFEPGSPGSRSNFPRRNETMAALACMTIITEATITSGTRHQVTAAIKLGRPVGFLASLAAQNFPWIEDALRSGCGFIIDSPSQISMELSRCFSEHLTTSVSEPTERAREVTSETLELLFDLPPCAERDAEPLTETRVEETPVIETPTVAITPVDLPFMEVTVVATPAAEQLVIETPVTQDSTEQPDQIVPDPKPAIPEPEATEKERGVIGRLIGFFCDAWDWIRKPFSK